ncbi:DUF4007 family protein [Streptomyces sp. MZ04]|uniref:DUF4007 family protein n=1 Tax=Streptomyces sp. MZ04 TaxID=2559236 RepID=UPI001FD75258|nr:DUF4007 family protein [Streptomyces sp. MZ04]
MHRPDATVVLGVGKSMLPAMSFWSQAFGLASREGHALVPTARARWLLDDEHGADPFLELDTSLWLLHWWLLSASPCHVPSWRYLFGYAPVSRYSRAELHGRLTAATDTADWKPPAPSVLASDIACIVSMYAAGDRTTTNLEDELSNPFRTLRLVAPEPSAGSTQDRSHLVTVHRGAGQLCPNVIQAYASLDYAARTAGPQPGSISLTKLASAPLGPGRLLLTRTEELRRALHQIAAQHPDLAVVHSADGEELLAFPSRPDHLAGRLLEGAYPACRPASR